MQGVRRANRQSSKRSRHKIYNNDSSFPSMNRSSTTISIFGLALICIGSYLPWITPPTITDGPYIPGMRSGLDTWGMLTFLVAFTTILGIACNFRGISSSTFQIAVGLLTTGVATLYLFEYRLTGPRSVDWGIGLLVVGASLLIIIHTQKQISDRR